MNGPIENLSGIRVLVVEDDYYLATDLQDTLEAAGAKILGPFPDEVEAGKDLDAVRPDCAFVDINLGQGPSFELPRALVRLGIPFAFVTGYDAHTIPDEFANVEHIEKPVDANRAVAVAARLLRRSSNSAAQ